MSKAIPTKTIEPIHYSIHPYESASGRMQPWSNSSTLWVPKVLMPRSLLPECVGDPNALEKHTLPTEVVGGVCRRMGFEN